MIDWFQNNKNGNILIHSQFGINRSALLLGGILSKFADVTLDQALQTISFKKPDIKITSKLIESEKIIQKDEYLNNLQQTIKSQLKTQQNCLFKCSKCRSDVFISNNLLHGIRPECNHYFVERPEWIDEFDQDGKINCKKCNQRVGDFKYIGAKCNCGEYICPAYMYNKAKVDKKLS